MELGAFFKYAPHGMEEDVSAARWFVSGPLALGGLLTVHFAAAKMVLCPSRKQVQKLAAAQSNKYRGYVRFVLWHSKLRCVQSSSLIYIAQSHKTF